jgi:neutral ceramidase
MKLLITGLFALFFGGLSAQTQVDPTDINASDNSRLYAGTAKLDITPVSIPDSLIHDRQFIRVTAFSDGENKALLIAHETMFTREHLWEEITLRIKEETGIAPEYVIMSAIHTHSGAPPGDDFNNKIMICVKEALANLKPAEIGTGKGECRMNINRRARAASGGIFLGMNPYGPCDHDVDVLRVDDEHGKPMSIMVNWACHAVVNWPKPKLYSGDWPGATAKYIEEAFQDSISACITIGASGDINPIYEKPWPYEFDKEKNARGFTIDGNAATAMYLGEEAIKVANNTRTYSRGKISAKQRLLILPGKKRFESRMPDQEIIQGDDLKIRLSAIKIGHIVLTGWGGEIMTEMGMHLKEQSPYQNTFVITHCNGSSGYIVTDEALSEGGFEPRGSKSMPGCEKELIDNLLEMISQL